MNPDPKERSASSPASDVESIDSMLRAIAREGSVGDDVLPGGALVAEARMPVRGEVFGKRYRIEDLLGKGGMGAVFIARHLKTGREVAIKVLLPRLGASTFRAERRARFLREAQAAGRIRHPNVVDVYDVEEEEGLPFLVMERLHGETLRQRLRREPAVLPTEAVRILLSAMRGVAEAHRKGVIHRDLKPDNIFLARTAEDAEPTPKVLDFGVSRIIAREDSEDPEPTTLTRTGYIIGTPAYMPLEQLRGGTEVGAQADIYALGVMLYEALAGERPYSAQNDHELIIRMVTESATPLRQKRPDLDPYLEGLVMKALKREPKERFESVDAFASALERWLSGERDEMFREVEPEVPADPTPASMTTSSPRARLGVAPRRVLWVVAALLAALLVFRASPQTGDIDQTPTPPPGNLVSKPPAVVHETQAGAEAPAPELPKTQSSAKAEIPASENLERPASPGAPRRRGKGASSERSQKSDAARAASATEVRLEDF